jgi:hypothetical protein
MSRSKTIMVLVMGRIVIIGVRDDEDENDVCDMR